MASILATCEGNEEHMEEDTVIDASGGMELESAERSIPSSTDEISLLKQVNETTVQVNLEEYIVEQLLDSKLIQRKMHYLVKWRGFDDPTWEPQNNIPLHMKRNFNKEKKH